jgi:hypothetical protein
MVHRPAAVPLYSMVEADGNNLLIVCELMGRAGKKARWTLEALDRLGSNLGDTALRYLTISPTERDNPHRESKEFDM